MEELTTRVDSRLRRSSAFAKSSSSFVYKREALAINGIRIEEYGGDWPKETMPYRFSGAMRGQTPIKQINSLQ